MDTSALLAAIKCGENCDWEFKSALGGVPGSLWETYSAMANTDGGTIVLGVSDEGQITGLPAPQKIHKSIWDTLHNPQKVSANLLNEAQVRIQRLEEKSVLILEVPRATRLQRPVYLNGNPLHGTYRRKMEGDYRCSESEVRRMFSDQSEDTFDGRVLEHFNLDDLDPATLKAYRNICEVRNPTHPWNALETKELLKRIGAWRADRTSGKEGLTVAGLMMFGNEQAILDPEAVPRFWLDYREYMSSDPADRWTDRVVSDGTWVCNIFQFYQRAILRLFADLKRPFRLGPDMVRMEESVVHEAVREAFVNALIHGDYQGVGGVIICRYPSRFEFSNPGMMLISPTQLTKGGISECRNRLLQNLFAFLGIGERAGSGLDKIFRGWSVQNWRQPEIKETLEPDRVQVTLSMLSLYPDSAMQHLREQFGVILDSLSQLEVQALVTAAVEGEVSNRRLQQLTEEHSADLTKVLQGLATRGFLRQLGRKRATAYQLSSSTPPLWSESPQAADLPQESDSPQNSEFPASIPEDSPQSAASSPQSAASSPQSAASSPQSSASSPQSASSSPQSLETIPEIEPLYAIASESRAHNWLPTARMRQLILSLCEGRYLTTGELSNILNRDTKGLRDRFIAKMVSSGLLLRKYPDDPNRPDQAYMTSRRP